MTMIAICGSKGSGKDTAAEYVCQQYGYTRYAFADEMKKSVMKVFGIPEITRENKETPMHCVVWDKVLREELRKLFNSSADVNQAFSDFFHIFAPYNHSINDASVDLFISPRKAMQLFGTDLCRDIQDNLWVSLTDSAIVNKDTAVMSDVRFYNEYDYVRENNGIVIKVLRDSTSLDEHISEAGIEDEDVDYIVYNDGSFEELYAQLDEVIGEIV